MKTTRHHLPRPACILWLPCLILALPPAIRAEQLPTSSGVGSTYSYSGSVSLSGSAGIAAAGYKNYSTGEAYFFRNLDTASGADTVTLIASDGEENDFFGFSTGLSGNTALVGARNQGRTAGAAYLFRNLNTASGTVKQNAKLIASDRAGDDYFGDTVSLSGNAGIVGASSKDRNGEEENIGAAYFFRNLDTASGTVTENAKLTASDGGLPFDYFGWSVSLSGNTGLVGAYKKDNSKAAAYLFRNLHTASGTVTEDARLTAASGQVGGFGRSVSISGNTGLVGTYEKDNNRGAAYFFRNLDTASGTVTENARLTASDGVQTDYFGNSVSLSGNAGLVGTYEKDNNRGAVYLFLGLDTASGTLTENVKVTASGGAANDRFGRSIALDGDRFMIGSDGKAWSGRMSAFTTLDEGGASRSTDRLSFVSQDDWVIGKNTDGNQLTLSAGDSGTVSAGGKAVYVGQNAGSDQNVLTVSGNLTANSVRVGAAGNTGNTLWVSGGGSVTATGGIIVAAGSSVGGSGTIKGDLRFSAASNFSFTAGQMLTVNGKVQFDGSFGVASLPGLGADTPAGTYPLLSGTATDFAASGLGNWGEANAYPLGNGKAAWLAQQGSSLQVVVGAAGVVVDAGMPVLNLSTASGQVTLSWTTGLNGLVLETSQNLDGVWSPVETVPQKTGDSYTLTLPMSEKRGYYRLRKQ